MTLAITSLLLAIVYGFTIGAGSYRALISSAIGGETYRIETDPNAQTIEAYPDNGMPLDQWMETADRLVQEVEGEGAVLLKNEGEVLPLTEGASVTLFGRSSVDLVMGGTGGGGFKSTRTVNLKTALEDVGFQVNPTVWSFYQSFQDTEGHIRLTAGGPAGFADEAVFVAEVDVDQYTQEVRDSYADYNEAAIVVISRIGGEGDDMPLGAFGDGERYLALQEDEKDLLREIQSSGQFDKVVVLLNTSNAMELSWLEEAEYGVDACLWIGGPGQSGSRAVADILRGAINPSGRLVDTYASNSMSSPAMQNFGGFSFTNEEEATVPDANVTRYVVYQEGIYVGYRYYETRYFDGVTNPDGSNALSAAGSTSGGPWSYTEEVNYPFGYGLSYGSEDGKPFVQTITGFEVKDDTVEVTIHVQNKGDMAGKSVVQLYVSAPYSPGGTEKAAVVLAGFAKTGILAPGGEEDVTISVDKYDIASYDYLTEKTYVLDAGEYRFAIGDGAHDAVNNVLASLGFTTANGMDYDGDGSDGAVRTWNNPSMRLFNTSIHGVEVTNQFDHANLTYYGKEIEYLTRSNWDTFPKPYLDLEATQEMIDDIFAGANYEPGSSDLSNMVFSAGNEGLDFASMLREDNSVVPFDDPLWDDLLDNMSLDDLTALVSQSYAAIPSIGFPKVDMRGGAAGNNTYPYHGTEDYTTGYCSEVVFASTFNTELIERVGAAMGEDWLRADCVGAFVPSANTHRAPYGGRNFEYFSEDGFLAGEMAAVQSRGVQSRGVISMLKHLALNDQESNRHGLCTFSNEQAIREIYLKAFEKAYSVEGAQSTMGGFNRIGCTWCNADEHLMKNVLRGEWGYTGIIATDLAMNPVQLPPRAALEAGTNSFLCRGDMYYKYMSEYASTDAKMVENMRESAHYLLYNFASCAAVNGLIQGAKIVEVTPYWEAILLVASGGLAVLTVVSAIMVVIAQREGFRQKRKISRIDRGTPRFYLSVAASVSSAAAFLIYFVAESRENSPLILIMVAVAAVVGILLCIWEVPFLEYLPVVCSLTGLAVFITLGFDEIGDILGKNNVEGLSPTYIASAVLILISAVLFEVLAVNCQCKKCPEVTSD